MGLKLPLQYFAGVLLSVLVFSGGFKILIGFSNAIVNLSVSLLVLALLIFSGIHQRGLVVSQKQKFYLSIFFYFLLLLSVYVAMGAGDFSKFSSFEYYFKAFIYLFVAIALVMFGTNVTVVSFIVGVVFLSLAVIGKYLGGFIVFDDASGNRLVFSMLVGVLGVVSIPLIFSSIRIYSLLGLCGLALSVIINFLDGSRGGILAVFGLLLLELIRYIRRENFYRSFCYIIGISLAFGMAFLAAIQRLEFNSWLLFKFQRLFVGDISDEPRYEIIQASYRYYMENFSVFGQGFHGAQYLSTSWDSSLPYLESFVLELVFNYGLFGVLGIMLLIFGFLDFFKLRGSLVGLISLYIFCYVFFIFNKSWSVYDGFVIFTVLALAPIVRRSVNGV